MELVNTNRQEVKEFVFALSDKEKRYYDLRWDVLSKEAVFVQGYRDNDELVGITGICRKYFIAYSSFHMVKESHWGRGIGTRMTNDLLQWAKEHHIPCVILQYYHENVGIVKALKKSGIRHDMKIGKVSYYIKPTARWAIPIKYIMLALAWGYCMTSKRNTR